MFEAQTRQEKASAEFKMLCEAEKNLRGIKKEQEKAKETLSKSSIL